MRTRCMMMAAVAVLAAAACTQRDAVPKRVEETGVKIAPDIEQRRAKFATHRLTADLDTLAQGDRKALEHLVAASRLVHEVFARQAWRGNPEFAQQVAALDGRGAGAARDYYRINVGPWDRLADFEPFLGERPRPPGAGYYPDDMTKQEFEDWLAAHPGDRAAFTAERTVIRREADQLVAVPYAREYAELLTPMAGELRAAAEATTNESLRRFLRLRADALLSDDYFESDMAWMDLDGPIEVVIGPYETYEDSLFGYKAAFESFVCVVAPEDSQRLASYKEELPAMERALPIPDEHKNLKRGSESPIRVADEVFTAGDTRAGVQTIAFNLPNDERVREAKGSKKVLLKNMMRAKYDEILVPIAARVLPEADAGRIDFDSYFQFVLLHEMSHGLGPGRITVGGRETEVRLELKDLYSAIEEAKADTLGALHVITLGRKGLVAGAAVEALPWTFVAGLFRSARFGMTEAHGLGVAIQAGYLLREGALEITPEGRFRPVPDRMEGALTKLAHDLLMAEAEGSYETARKLVETYGTPAPEMARVLDSLRDIPVDIDPEYAFQK